MRSLPSVTSDYHIDDSAPQLTRELLSHGFHTSQIHVQLVHVMLTKVSNPDVPVHVTESTHRIQITKKYLQQRRLTSTVFTNLYKTYVNLCVF